MRHVLSTGQEHRNAVDNSEKALGNYERWKDFHKNALGNDLRMCHVDYTKEIYDKANQKLARTYATMKYCKVLGNLGYHLH